jgi:hypothetical protein
VLSIVTIAMFIGAAAMRGKSLVYNDRQKWLTTAVDNLVRNCRPANGVAGSARAFIPGAHAASTK